VPFSKDNLWMNRKALLTFLKIMVVLSAMVWLRGKVDMANVGRVLANANLWYVFVAAALYWTNVFMAGLRWQLLLKTLSIRIPLRTLVAITHIGQFFTLFLPGVAGDDGTRFVYIARLAPGRVKQACSTVLLDRTLGFASLFILTTVCIPINWNVLQNQQTTRWVGVGFLTAGVLMLSLCAVFLACKKTFLENSFHKVQSLFPGSYFISELVEVALAFTGNRARLCLVSAAALLAQALVCCAFWSAGSAVGIHLPLWTWMSFVPVILVASVLPITFAGIGVRDYLLFLFLGAAVHMGAGSDQIAALSLLMLLCSLLLAVIGGLVYLVYKPAAKSLPKAPAAV
jgi:uncharacterized protein (TIRG00374 family)